MGEVQEHWLVRAARQAGLAGADTIRLPARASVEDVWTSVARACNVTDQALAGKVAPHVRTTPAEFGLAEDRPTKLVPEAVARRFRVFPLRAQHNQLIVATSDPADLATEQALAFCAGRRIVFELAAPSQVKAAIESTYSPDRLAERLLTTERVELSNAIRLVQRAEPESVTVQEADKAPVVRLTNLIMHDAIAAGASDVHIEPDLRDGQVRVRIDGVMQNYMSVPQPVLDRLVSRLKVMGNMDVSDRLRPHAGRAHIEAHGVAYDLRISTVPTRQSEKAVVRVLSPGKSQLLADLALPEPELKRLRQLVACKDGLVVVTGPTGSGKTTTLYAALREIATGKVNVITVEDPVEYEMAGVTQIQVAPRQSLTFASVLRTVLRQDPDVILVGEIRDFETAEIALQASMTGHLVLTTLHTNDAAGVIPRLAGLGLNRASIASSLRGVVAQRLVRRVCPECRTAGCDACRGTGYRGRIPIVEMFLNTPAIEQAIAGGANPQDLNRVMRESGMAPMLTAARDRVKTGETTMDEVDRVLGKPQEEEKSSAPLEPHILVAATDPAIRSKARNLLERGHWRVSEAADGPAALQRAGERNDFVLVLVDVEMAGMDGRQVLSQLKSSPATLALPVLMLAPSDDDLELSLMAQGADDCISKPIDAAAFLRQVNACLRRIGSSDPAGPGTEVDRFLDSSRPSLAVLPFKDMSPGRDQGYLCDGVAEDLLGALSKLDGLHVASRTSSFRARAADVDVRDLGRQLGVGAVLEGSVQKSGSRLRISAHLINVEDGYDLWSGRYDRKLEDVFELQDEIARSIVAALRVVLLGRPAAPIIDVATKNTAAYDLYLRGRHHWNMRTEEGLHRSVELFSEAARLDSGYALAQAGLADAYVTLGIYGAVPPAVAMPAARKAAEHALTLDARSAEAVCALGSVRALYVWDWEAEADFTHAIELDPRNAKVHHSYASNFLLPLARFGEARAGLDTALRLEPLSPVIHATLGVLLYFERRFDEAVEHLKKTMEADRAFGFAPYFLGQVYAQLARHDEAIAALCLAEKLAGRSPEVVAALAYAQTQAGQSEDARNTMDELIRMSGRRYVSPVLLSQVALGMGDTDRALAYLRQACEVRATDLVWIGVRPVFDAVRSESAFVELRSQVLSS